MTFGAVVYGKYICLYFYFFIPLATGFVTVLKPICMADILQAVSRVHPLCLLCSWLFVGGI